MADAFLDRDYDVEVIQFDNLAFRPRAEYRVLVSARTNLERLADRAAGNPLTIAHLDTSHYVYNNRAAYERVFALQQRRGITSRSIRLIEANAAIERAALGTVLGNRDFTLTTYAYAGKPLYPLPVPAAPLPWLDRDYETARRRFLWLGSAGFVHKGLDLVLEAFAATPDLALTVCGPLAQDAEFTTQFERELYRTPNVHAHGWVDVGGAGMVEIARRTIAFIYPSCAEGQAGSAVIAMHAGLVPIVTPQTGIDVGDFGVLLRDSGIAAIADAVQYVANLPIAELRDRSRAAWEYAQRHHTAAAYRAAYDAVLDTVLPA